MAKENLQIKEPEMFKIKFQKTQKPLAPINKRKYKYLSIPKDKDANKSVRTLRYLEAPNGVRVFVEKLKNYDIYVISFGTNPGAVTVLHVASDLRSAITLSKNKLAELEEQANKQQQGR